MKPAIRTSPAAERAVIGTVIAYPEVRHVLHLDPADFYDQRHGALWAAVTGSKVDLDLAGLIASLVAKGTLDLAGGLEYVASLVDGLPNPAQAPVLAEQIRQLAAIRRAQRTLLEFMTQPVEFVKAAGAVADAPDRRTAFWIAACRDGQLPFGPEPGRKLAVTHRGPGSGPRGSRGLGSHPAHSRALRIRVGRSGRVPEPPTRPVRRGPGRATARRTGLSLLLQPLRARAACAEQ